MRKEIYKKVTIEFENEIEKNDYKKHLLKEYTQRGYELVNRSHVVREMQLVPCLIFEKIKEEFE